MDYHVVEREGVLYCIYPISGKTWVREKEMNADIGQHWMNVGHLRTVEICLHCIALHCDGLLYICMEPMGKSPFSWV